MNFTSLFKPKFTFSVCRTVFSRTKFSKSPQSNASGILKQQVRPFVGSQTLELPPKVPVIPKQKFDFFLVTDFKFNIDALTQCETKEIIEFPVVKINAETFRPEASFHSYVRPTVIPELYDYCTSVTDITQEMVDDEPDFKVVFQNFSEWLEKEVSKPDDKFAFVVYGDSSLKTLFPLQCQISGIEVPDYMKRWINIVKSFRVLPPHIKPASLSNMLKFCDLLPEGQFRSEADDVTNIMGVLKDLAERGLVYDYNELEDIDA